MTEDLKKYSGIHIDGMVSKITKVELSQKEVDKFWEDFINFIENKNLMFGGGFGGVTKEDKDKL